MSRSSGILAVVFWLPGLCDGSDVQVDRHGRSGRLSSVTSWHVVPLVRTSTGLRWFSLMGSGVQADRAWDDWRFQILLRFRDEKYWGLNFGSLHTPVWGQLSTKGNRPLGSLQEFHKITGIGDSLIPSLNWKHQNKKKSTVLWFENMREMLDWAILDGRTSNHKQTVIWFWQMFFFPITLLGTGGSLIPMYGKWGTGESLILTFWCFLTHLCITHRVPTSITYSKGRQDETSFHPFVPSSIRPSVPSWSVYFDRAEKTMEYRRGGCSNQI